MAFDIFFNRIGRTVEVSGELLSFYLFLTNCLEAIGVLALMRARLWTATTARSWRSCWSACAIS